MITYDIPAPNFGCGWGDLGCVANQTVAGLMSGMVGSMGDFIGEMLTGAFSQTAITDQSWSIADGQFWFWVSVMTFVLAGVALFQLIPVVLLRNWRRMGTILAGLALAIPAASLAVWLMQKATTFGDDVTNSLISSLQDQSMSAALLRMFGYANGPDGTAPIMMANQFAVALLTPTATPAGAEIQFWVGQAAGAAVITGLMALASLFLYIGMAIRGFGLVALAATAPIGIMMVGQPKVGVWAAQWVKLAVGLILAKPLAAAVLVLAVHICGTGTSVSLIIVAIGAVFAAAFAPLWAVKLVSFASAEVDAAMKRPSAMQGVQLVSTGKNLTR